MNAVNLIPLERRRSDVPSLPGVPFLGLLAALVLAFVGTFAYVSARDQVASRQSELAHVHAATAEWSTAAARYTPAISALKEHAKQFAELGSLLGQRANWSQLLGQLAGVMPAHAELASLSATASAPTTGAAAGSAAAGTTPATAAAASTSGTTSGGSGITITGCAVSQPVVADTMVALRRIAGVSTVSLSSSSLQTSSGSGGGAGSSGCRLPVQFSLALQFTPSTELVHLLLASTTGHAAASAAPAATQTTPVSGSAGAAR